MAREISPPVVQPRDNTPNTSIGAVFQGKMPCEPPPCWGLLTKLRGSYAPVVRLDCTQSATTYARRLWHIARRLPTYYFIGSVLRPTLLRLFAIALLLPLAVQAADPPAADTDKPAAKTPAKKPDTKLDTIEVKTSVEDDTRRDDTATKIVVNAAEINKFGDTQLADVLKRLPGVTVIGSSIRMRGLGNGYTQILIDGERAPPGFTIDQLSPTMIERIEVIRAATAEFSTQSIAGTINIVLKKKVSLAQREIRGVYAQGSFYKSKNSNFVMSDKDGDLSWSVNGYIYDNINNYPYRGSETGFDANGVLNLLRTSSGLSHGNSRGGGVGPRLSWALANGDTLTWQSFVNLNRGDGRNNFAYEVSSGPALPYQNSQSRSAYQNDFLRTDLNWIHKLAGNAKLDWKVGAYKGKNRNDNFLQGFNFAGQQNLERTVNTSSSDEGFTFAGKFSTPIIEGHSLVTGWDTGLNKRSEHAVQQDKPFPGVLPAVTAFNTDEVFNASVLKLAAFAQDEWNITPQWSVYLGLRWEGLTTTSEGQSYAKVHNRSSVWSPLMQTLYKLPDRKGEQLRLALTRTYKAPGTGQLVPRLFTSVENKPTSPDSRGNPDLRPELATGIDVAFEKFWEQGASMSLSGSARRITDYNRRGLLLINGRWVSLPINDGTAVTKSIEFDAKFPVQTLWKEAPPVDFRFNMNRNWSHVDAVPGPNNRLDQQTPFSATLGLDYRMKNGVLVAGGSYSFRSGGLVRTAINQDAYLTTKRDLDLYGLWKITPKTQIRLTLSNILHPAAVNESSYFDEFGVIRRSNTTPSKMNIRAGLEVKF